MWIQTGTFCNRGFFYGPWLPVYGLGSVVLYKILSPIRRRPLPVFFLSGILGVLTELIVGLTLKTYWNLKYWDYRGLPLEIDGYVCLYSFLGFCFAGLLWVCFVSRWIEQLLRGMKKLSRTVAAALLTALFLADVCYSLTAPNQGSGITFSSFLVSYTLGL